MKMKMMKNLMMVMILLSLCNLGYGQFPSLAFENRSRSSNQSSSIFNVSSLFIIGDSSVSCGSDQSFFYSLLRPSNSLFSCNQPHTQLLPDLLAKKMGLPNIPAFEAQNGTIQGILSGLNYGSTEATIMISSGKLGFQGLNQQLRQAFETLELLEMELGEERALNLIKSSIFYLSLGKDDFIDFLHSDNSSAKGKYGSKVLTQMLVNQMVRVVKDLYNANVKKIVCMGILPLGCAPRTLWESYNSTTLSGSAHDNMTTENHRRECNADVNDLVFQYNAMLSEQLLNLNLEFPDARIIFCDVYQAMMEVVSFPRRYGFDNVNSSCCGMGRYGGLVGCQAVGMACLDPSTHFWWDLYNPTQAVHSLLSDSAWSGHPFDICRPISIEQLAAFTSTSQRS